MCRDYFKIKSDEQIVCIFYFNTINCKKLYLLNNKDSRRVQVSKRINIENQHTFHAVGADIFLGGCWLLEVQEILVGNW